jgi:hypothetical protein
MNTAHSAAHDFLAEHAPDRPELAAAVAVAAWLAEHPGEGLADLLGGAAGVLARAGLDQLENAVGIGLAVALDRRPGGVWRGRSGLGDHPWGDVHADYRQPMFAPPPIDLGPRIETARRSESEMINTFLADVGVGPDTHHLVVYPAPDDRPPGQERHRDFVFVAVPVESWHHLTGQYPPRDEACRRWPHRRIWQECVAEPGPR